MYEKECACCVKAVPGSETGLPLGIKKSKEKRISSGTPHPCIPIVHSPYLATLTVCTGDAVAGKVTGVDNTYRLNCFAPPHLLVRSVVVVATPLVVYVLTLPEQASVHAPAPYSEETAEPLKSNVVPP